jgi:DNA-binding PadR family transcriptional regulator
LSLGTPLHGYGIIKKVEELTLGRLTLAAGTLYGALQNLQKQKYILMVDNVDDKKGKKIYSITDEGKNLLKLELKRLKEMVINGEELKLW